MKEEHCNVGNQTLSSRRTLFSSTRPSHVSHDIAAGTSKHKSLHASSNEERPHSKTPVLGRQIKTRLTCNHTKPKCEACVANRKKSFGYKHRSLFSDKPKQSHVLPSSRSIPRGSSRDGRKLYEQEYPPQQSLSVVDATWIPGQDTYAKSHIENLDTGVISSRNDLINATSKEGTKKKVQFVDKDGNTKKKQLIHKVNNIGDYKHKADNKRQSIRKKEKSPLQQNENGKKSSLVGDTDSMRNYDDDRFHSPAREPDFSDKDDAYNSTSTSDHDLSERRYKNKTCKLCDSLKNYCTKHRTHLRHTSSRRHPPLGRLRTYSLPMPSSTEDDDHCILCQRYSKDHYYVDDSDCCHLCEAPYERRRIKSDSLFSNPFCCARVPPPPLPEGHISRPPLCRQWSSPMFYSDGEEGSAFKKIPYEPKTDMVKDLKKKIEDEYLHREYLQKKKNLHRRWRSWDAEDLEELRSFRRHRCIDPWKYVPQHKCVHHYLQNNRLFLEPTLANEDGSSLCSGCGAPQPQDHERDPYLYHITLGGLHREDKYEKEIARRKHPENFLENSGSGNLSYKGRSQRPNQTGKSVKRLPGDTSKHIFAKLNHSVDNIFPSSSQYQFRPDLADQLRYKVSPFTKRHPSKSMALVDHLL